MAADGEQYERLSEFFLALGDDPELLHEAQTDPDGVLERSLRHERHRNLIRGNDVDEILRELEEEGFAIQPFWVWIVLGRKRGGQAS